MIKNSLIVFNNLCLALFFIVLVSCSGNTQTLNDSIESLTEFKKMSSLPLYQKYGKVSAVKVVYHIKQKSIHFVSAKNYKFHYDYCRDVFEPFLSLEEFNEVNYANTEDRKYLIGNINYYENSNSFVLEIGSSVEMDVEQIETLFLSVKENTYFGNELSFLLNTASSIQLKNQLNISTIESSAIYGAQNYQPIHEGKTFGMLRVLESFEGIDTISHNSILVLKGSPTVLPIVNGVLTNTFQTPLSHIQILGKHRKMPSAALKNIFNNKELLALNGTNVMLTVTNDTVLISSYSGNNSLIQKKPKIKLKYDLDYHDLIQMTDCKLQMKNAIGNKAYNFSLLLKNASTIGYKVPESAFAIPFSWYNKHMKVIQASKWIDLIEQSESKLEKLAFLDSLRSKIINYPISQKDIAEIQRMITQLGPYKRMRFRSSTNAEDADGFSGAGLYTSKTGIIGDSIKSIDKALKKVWASTWSSKAYFERDYFGINHKDVKMGVLVHRSFPNEAVNGVAITQNLYRKNYYGYVLNCQKGDVSVVDQNDTLTAEQLIVYPKNLMSDQNIESTYDVITYSSLSRSKLLLSDEELDRLSEILEKIQNQFEFYRGFSSNYSRSGISLDIEFKIDSISRQIYIKQVRPY